MPVPEQGRRSSSKTSRRSAKEERPWQVRAGGGKGRRGDSRPPGARGGGGAGGAARRPGEPAAGRQGARRRVWELPPDAQGETGGGEAAPGQPAAERLLTAWKPSHSPGRRSAAAKIPACLPGADAAGRAAARGQEEEAAAAALNQVPPVPSRPVEPGRRRQPAKRGSREAGEQAGRTLGALTWGGGGGCCCCCPFPGSPRLSPPHLLPALSVASVDWKRPENTAAHHTDQYRTQEMVVRRGQAFAMTIAFQGSQPPRNLTFVAETGATAALKAKTRVAFAVTRTPRSGSWSAVHTASQAGSVTVSIVSPPSAIIGRYTLSVMAGAGAPATSLGTLCLLFNPWLAGDEVFLSSSAERQEYVLSEFGLVFMGSANRIGQAGWNFGQFQDDILDISLTMLDRSRSATQDAHRDLTLRNDPKHVGRVMSAMVNSNDDSGVLQGNWSGNYRGGQNPSSWTGSVDILRQWKASGYRAVKYGQCWVFAGVLNTVLRCLGIPTRMITNFNSAHDTDRSLTIDDYYDASGNPLNIGGDSIWNFHVWNESWFVRSDIGSAFNGWQILDATPQERSSGLFQCGPASLRAIKEGDVDLKYDSPFVFSEVNADRVTWLYNTSTGETKRLHTETRSVGQYTSTKAVGSYARQDVTGSYKYAEGSAEERRVFEKARLKLNLNTMSSTAREFAMTKPSVSGSFKVERTPEVGKDVCMALRLTNHAAEPKAVKTHMAAWTIIYTGKPIHEVWKSIQDVTLGPKEEKTFPITISYEAYQQYLTTDNMIHTTALCHVEKEEDNLVERVVTLDNPSLIIKLLGEAKVNEQVPVEVLFTNPLTEDVKDCVLLAEGSDLLAEKLRLEAPPLKAKQVATIQFAVAPTRDGTKQLLVNFSCDKFQDVKAFETVEVAP
ncbi:protein-glutamine gamma-glutamyltransferase E-like [Heteronotia binoei]|uniref:protein-glutamine gamma-glutamyltransferase E-like n=1 Tax=Heteronotia binoei TaxID=13085 RepID=UPI00292F4404|nr:protein-glutamine gamma-glutamyltransferase E-like [Heteronotia binoei]